MFRWSAFPFIRISISLITGIIAFEHFPSIWGHYFFTLSVISIFFLLSWVFLRQQLVYSLISFLFITYLGGLLTLLNDQTLHPDHYLHRQGQGFVGVVSSDASHRANYDRYQVKLHQVWTGDSVNQASGTLHLYVKKGAPTFHYGNVVLVKERYTVVRPPTNPHVFNYREFLRNQHVYAQSFVDSSQVTLIDHQPEWKLLQWTYGIREGTQKKLDGYINQGRERAVLSALLLGIKDHLDNDLKDSYAAAGAMHVLAVSGLHVGIIYFLIILLLKPLKTKKYGRFVVAGIGLTVIWMYALITGFSPSVMRAATMFSVIIISDAVNRRSNIYNSLGIAAFLLILLDPYIIYSVGFQLSFIAVIGIVTLHPWLYRLYVPATKVGDYIWSITCVSIAAQLATFPLSAYYFHQFPTYFLLANLMVIPAALVLLSGGLFMIASGLISDAIGSSVGWLLEWVTWTLNESMGIILNLPYPLIDWLYYNQMEVLMIYLIMGFLIYGVGKQSFKSLLTSGVLLLILLTWSYRQELFTTDQRKIVFYDLEDQVGIDLVYGKDALLLLNEPFTDEEDLSYQVEPNRLASGLPKPQNSIQYLATSPVSYTNDYYSLIWWQDKKIIVMNRIPPLTFEKPLFSDICYVNTDAFLDIEYIRTPVLIVGSSVPFYRIQELKVKLKDTGVIVHHLADGYFELDLTNKTNDHGTSPI